MTIREILTQKIGRYSPQERGPPFTEIGRCSRTPLSIKGFIFDRLSPINAKFYFLKFLKFFK